MNKVLILDFGSQYTQLIARRIREEKVYCEIQPYNFSLEQILAFNPQAILLSGGPASVLSKQAPSIDPKTFGQSIPILGICYGMQLMAHLLGGRVIPSKKREYGKSLLTIKGPLHQTPLEGMPSGSVAWMSHGDTIEIMPNGFEALVLTDNGILAGMADRTKKLYALQFHPEVVHTQYGKEILRNFLFKVALLTPDWTMQSFLQESILKIQNQVGAKRVILGLSGGVDSSVAAVLLHRAIGRQLTCIFVNNGLLRKNEAKKVQALFRHYFHGSFKYRDASGQFLKALQGVKDPEKKRKMIGRIFIRVFEKEAKKIKGACFLAQGTLYPDVIESISFKGPSAVIKSHHNVGGLPKRMGLELIEPFRELFKDEVRALGQELDMAPEILNRHPFPGPGLAIRILGAVNETNLCLLREADAIVLEEIKKSNFYEKVWQAFAVLLPVKSVGVMGDERTYENVCALRVVQSVDGMTADWVDIPHEVLGRISNRIINEVKGINRVVYDISSKPPATIEWE